MSACNQHSGFGNDSQAIEHGHGALQLLHLEECRSDMGNFAVKVCRQIALTTYSSSSSLISFPCDITVLLCSFCNTLIA